MIKMEKEKIAITIDKNLLQKLGNNKSGEINSILKNYLIKQDERDKKINKIIDSFDNLNKNDEITKANFKLLNDNINELKKNNDIKFYILSILILIAILMFIIAVK